MADEIAKRMRTSRKNALRLVLSETTHASENASIEASSDAGVKKMEVVSTPSDRYHFVDPTVNGKVFEIGSPQQVMYTPPISYPACRCVLVPVFENNVITISEAPKPYSSFSDWKKATNKKTTTFV